MKNLVVTAILILATISSFAQPNSSEFVTWKYSARKLGGVYEIRLTATIKDGWKLYAQGKDASPTPTVVTFTNNPVVEIVGKTTEAGRLIKSTDKFYPIKYYQKLVAFEQIVRLKDSNTTTISGSIKFAVENGAQRAKPSVVNFSVEIGK